MEQITYSQLLVLSLLFAVLVAFAFHTSTITIIRFQHPINGHVENPYSGLSWLWVLLFGPFYWAVRGVWRHAILHFVLFVATLGIASLVYAFLTYGILITHYRRSGWRQMD